VAGAWFAIGPVVSRLWGNGQPQPGSPVGGSTLSAVVEEIGFFTGLGVVIVFLAAAALGRFSVIGVREHLAAVRSTPVIAEPPIEAQPTTVLPTLREPRHALDNPENDEKTE
jgi:hypothetical protein